MTKDQRKQEAIQCFKAKFLEHLDSELYYGEILVLGEYWSCTSDCPQALKDALKHTAKVKMELESELC